MADSNIAGLPTGAAVTSTDLIAGSNAGSGTLVKKTALQLNTYIQNNLSNLPTTDPHLTGMLWNNGGLIAISTPFLRSLAGASGAYALTGSAAALVAAGVPTFQVDFTAIGALPAQVTLTRASIGTYFDSSGVLQTATTDAPRFDHDPATLAANGLLIEESRTNLALQSEDSSSLNGGVSSGVTITADSTVAPDGNTTADTLAFAADGFLYRRIVAAPGTYTLSGFLKAGSNTSIALRASEISVSQTVVNVTTTFQRFYINLTLAGGGSGVINFGLDTRALAGADGNAHTVIAWGWQIESGLFPTSYIPTTTVAVTRSADVALLTGTATAALEGSAASAILEAQLFATTPAGTEVLFGKSPVSYSFVRTATTLSFFSGGADLTATFGSSNISSAFRTAISFDGSTRNIVINGGTLVSGATISAVTGDVPLGGFAAGAQMATGWYRKMAIYNSRLIDATLTSKSVVGTPF